MPVEENPGLPAWLDGLLRERLARLTSQPLDDRLRGEIRGALDAAIDRGDITADVAATWYDNALPTTTTVHFEASASTTVDTSSSHRVAAPWPVEPRLRRMEPDFTIASDAQLGEFMGAPIRLLGIGLFPTEVQVAVSLVATPAFMELQRAEWRWRESLRHGERRTVDSRPVSATAVFRRHFRVSDDVGTAYVSSGGGGGGSWALTLRTNYQPSPPQIAREFRVHLLDDEGQQINMVRVPLHQ